MIITDKIKENTALIQTFSKNEAASKKSKEQKRVDEVYKESVLAVKTLVYEVVNTCAESRFIISSSIKNEILELLNVCFRTSNKERVETVDINTINTKEKEVRNLLQYEWNSYYIDETSSVEDVLNVIKNIANVDVNSLLIKIRAAKDWNKDISTVKSMMNSISEAKSQIDKMKLTETTVDFLRKVIGKTATLEDITEEVLEWLAEENLKGKVKISF